MSQRMERQFTNLAAVSICTLLLLFVCALLGQAGRYQHSLVKLVAERRRSVRNVNCCLLRPQVVSRFTPSELIQPFLDQRSERRRQRYVQRGPCLCSFQY